MADRLYQAALHEVGHRMAAALLRFPLRCAFLFEDLTEGGIGGKAEYRAIVPRGPAGACALLVVKAAGRAADELSGFGNPEWVANADRAGVAHLAGEGVTLDRLWARCVREARPINTRWHDCRALCASTNGLWRAAGVGARQRAGASAVLTTELSTIIQQRR